MTIGLFPGVIFFKMRNAQCAMRNAQSHFLIPDDGFY